MVAVGGMAGLTPAITGRQQAAKPAVAAPVHCKVRRHGVLTGLLCQREEEQIVAP